MTEYLVKFRALPSGVPAEARLKRLLKLALRACDFRCMEITEVDQPEDPPQRHKNPAIKPPETAADRKAA